MHPADVAEYVGEQVEDLRARFESGPDLGVRGVSLNGSELLIRFTKRERALVKHAVPSALKGPGGSDVQIVYDVPDLGAKPQERELIVRFGCEDFDGQPPTAELLLADGKPLPGAQWPRDMANGGIIQGHPHYGRHFFCRPGLREFHTHPQHEDQPWDKYRESMPLPAIVIGLLTDLRKRWTLN